MLKPQTLNKSEEGKPGDIRRRDFLQYSAATLSSVSLACGSYGCASMGGTKVQSYPIDPKVLTTTQRMISFPIDIKGLSRTELNKVSQYAALGYGNWTFGAGLPVVQRTDTMRAGYSNPSPRRNQKFLNFFAFTDIHLTDKEAPNQLIYMQQKEPFASNNTSIYSPVMLYTTQVLDAAIQTVNALHQQNPIDFGISLGDTCNSTQYNELRWYMDVIDGKLITPSSGAHAGADSIDYQKPYQAVGLDKSIPWYQVMGNHDHFYIGSFPIDADPALGVRKSYTADTVWAVGNALTPHLAKFPVLFNTKDLLSKPTYYMGLIDGATPYGTIIKAGAATDAAFAAGAPKLAADPGRRSLLRSQWVQEFFNTSSSPVGHGFNLVDQTQPQLKDAGFACYSFQPKASLPLKLIVLDNTQSESDGSNDIHGHGYLDARRWAWLQAELAAGQAANQLMIIAAHIPIGVAAIGTEVEWWLNEPTTAPEHRNAVDLAGLLATLQKTPNLLMWIAGHRHVNAVKAFVSADASKPEQGFWQIETASLRDFPQQFRTFEIYLNSDYTISIVTTNVDPAVAEGTPAATSRKYAIATQQIINNELTVNTPNVASIANGRVPVPSMDPSRPQDGTPDPTIKYVDLAASGVPYNASYNAELFKQLSPRMVGILKALYPQTT